MVFSNTALKTHSILKVVEIDRLKSEKSQQVENSAVEAHTSLALSASPGSYVNEDFLKSEPKFESNMLNESDCEFFQELGLWCSPDKEEQVPIIDEKTNVNERAYNTTTHYTQISPVGFDGFDANSPQGQSGFYSSTPKDSLSPNADNNKFLYPDITNDSGIMPEEFLDIGSLPIHIEDLPFDINTNPQLPLDMNEQSWVITNEQNYTQPYTHTPTPTTMPFIDQEDSLGYDTKCITWSNDILINEKMNNDVIVSEVIIDEAITRISPPMSPMENGIEGPHLTLNISAQAPNYDTSMINTPDILNCVEQLETEKYSELLTIEKKSEECGKVVPDDSSNAAHYSDLITAPMEYEPVTPKTESHIDSENEDTVIPSKRKRRNSEDSDETYTPYSDKHSPKKFKRKRNIPIKDMIQMLEVSQQKPARRGRPPKRRESTISSVGSIDDNSSSISTQEHKYRELRDKNNEASKRSRMNRKLKELQMEQEALNLEQRNKKLRVKAEILEELTTKLKNALLEAMLNKK